jgi:hypothetical protein
MVYAVAPFERYGVMKHILSFVPTDAGLRNILTDPTLLSEPRRVDGRMNVAKAANAYTRMFFGKSIRAYVAEVRSGREPEGICLRTPKASNPTAQPSRHPTIPDDLPPNSLRRAAMEALLRAPSPAH